MADKEYICGYPKCLHHGEKVKESEAVVVGKKHYHWDCVMTKQEIQECIALYIENVDDKKQYPIAIKVINSLVFNSSVPIKYIKERLKSSGQYYKNKPAHVLYGIKKSYYEGMRKEQMGGR